jgi:hypothetical protein
VVLKLFRLARELNSTSLADFIATRLGRSSALAATVTAIAVIGMVPYLALQLKAVAMSHGLVTRGSDLAAPPEQDSAQPGLGPAQQPSPLPFLRPRQSSTRRKTQTSSQTCEELCPTLSS